MTTEARPAAIAAALLSLVLGSAAVARAPAPSREVGPLSADALDAIARGRAPGEALLLGRSLPLDAPASAWALVPGIGPRTADAMVEARPRTVHDLACVRGIGPARRAVLAGLVRPATDPSPTPERPCRSP